MIAKILPIKKPIYFKLLDYVVNDKDRLFDDKGRSFLITHNIMGIDIKEWIKQFKENETFRKIHKSNSVLLYHEIISFHKEDDVSLEIMEDITREYIQLRNSGGMFVAVPHFDKDHYHIHLAISGLEYRTGNAMRLSKTDLAQLKQRIQKYQIEKYPELNKSVVNHGNSVKKVLVLPDKEYQIKRRTGRATDKENVIEILKDCYKKAKSPKDFFEMIREYWAEPYVRGGKISGVVFQGRKFRLKRIGFSSDKIEELDREMGLKKVRENKKNKVMKI